MVLEAAVDDSPASGYDPFGTSSDNPSRSPTPPNGLRIDLSHASRPFPIMGPLLGFNNRHLVELTSNIARNVPLILQRPITQDEVDGTVAAVSKYMQWHSWIYCNGLIAGAFHAHATKPEMRFPWEKMFRSERISVSLNMDTFGPLRGPMARVAWNTVRSSLWVAAWGAPAYIVGAIAGRSMMAVNQLKDPRMKNFARDMQDGAAQRRLEAASKRHSQGLPNSSSQQGQQEKSGMDDVSPQAEEEPVMSSGEAVRTRGEEQYMRVSLKELAPRYSTGERRMDDGRDTWQQSQPESSPFGAPPETSSSGPASTGGSAWDRIRNSAGQTESVWDRVRRQGAAADKQGNRTQSWQSRAAQNNSNSAGADSFSFDQSDEERQLARTEAQRDFNARIERERQGQDFGDSNERGKW